MVQAPCQPLQVAGQLLALRPVRKEDKPRLWQFLSALSGEIRACQCPAGRLGVWSPELVQRLFAIDFTRDMALVVVRGYGLEDEEVVAVGGYFAREHETGCDFALAVAEAWRRQGLGRYLLDRLMACAASHGY